MPEYNLYNSRCRENGCATVVVVIVAAVVVVVITTKTVAADPYTSACDTLMLLTGYLTF
jgi:hypothetical protein